MNSRDGNNNQKSERGRPKNTQQITVVHSQRQQKAEQIKQYWTQHRITLIAYEAQYIYNKKATQKQFDIEKQQKKSEVLFEDNKKGDQKEKQKKRKGRKKADPQFQTGFLFSSNKDKNQSTQDIKVQQLIKSYQNLTLLFNESNTDVDDIELRQFMKIMLELKNEQIIHQFLPIYDLIYQQISKVEFEKIQKQKDRIEFLKDLENKLHNLIINSPPQKYITFKEYLKNDLKQTLKLLYVESYCFLAQKFNFNINEFYSQAFSITLQHNKTGNKKVKGQ